MFGDSIIQRQINFLDAKFPSISSQLIFKTWLWYASVPCKQRRMNGMSSSTLTYGENMQKGGWVKKIMLQFLCIKGVILCSLAIKVHLYFISQVYKTDSQ